MNKGDLSESDIKAKFYHSRNLKAGWGELTQLGKSFLTAGTISYPAQTAKTLRNFMRRRICMFSVVLPIKRRDESFEDVVVTWGMLIVAIIFAMSLYMDGRSKISDSRDVCHE